MTVNRKALFLFHAEDMRIPCSHCNGCSYAMECPFTKMLCPQEAYYLEMVLESSMQKEEREHICPCDVCKCIPLKMATRF